MKNILILIISILAVYAYVQNQDTTNRPNSSTVKKVDKKVLNFYQSKSSNTDDLLKKAFQNRFRSYQINGRGRVIKILPDDNKGSRHQKFIIKLNSNQTLLIAHNIDLAPRVQGVRIGSQIEFYGEYEYNSKGGVIHWTHHDPSNKHVSGWIKHNGKLYK